MIIWRALRRRIVVLLAVALTLSLVGLPQADAASSLFGLKVPAVPADLDGNAVELGVRFTPTVDGTVSGVRFYKSAANTGTHTGSLWSDDGVRLATVTFVDETASGWQSATFDTPVAVQKGVYYRASYLAPSGRYAGDVGGFDQSYTRGGLSVPVGGGVYDYGGQGGFPTSSWMNSNYYVDVAFTPTSSGSTVSPTRPGSLNLPRVPWEGGPDYYAQFPASGGFADPDFFPIGVWYAEFDSDANVKWDKDHGVNFYVQLGSNDNGSLLGRNGMYWVGDEPLPRMEPDDPAWAGYWLSDETDGRYSAEEGQAEIAQEVASQRGPGCPDSTYCRFAYANYTGIVTSAYNDEQAAAAETYVNMFDGPVSVDGYYYTDPSCDDPGRQDYQMNAPLDGYCRTAAAYGNLIHSLRVRDAADGDLKPLWGFVENGAPGSDGRAIQPDQMKGAVMSMIINEARGIVWFNQSFSGDCEAGNVIRDAEANPDGCNAARVEAMKEIDTFVQRLAPVLNTQSYVWDFSAPGVQTMLKAANGSAYVFADVALNADPGRRTLTLPPTVSASSVEVVGENRTLPVVDHTFTDTFAQESSYHVYKVSLAD